jgi:Dyp-type peroxidase family
MDLDLSDIQGNIVPGFKKDHQAFVFVSLRDGESGRAWVRALHPEIASAEEVSTFNSLFSKLRARRNRNTEPDSGVLGVLAATWVNIAFSFRGLQILRDGNDTEGLPAAFKSNRVAGMPMPERYSDVDALLIVASDQTDDLEAELLRQRQRLRACDVREVTTLRGDTLPGDWRGREHFGFKDAISQPGVEGVGGSPSSDAPVRAGEFVLGYTDQSGNRSGVNLPDWCVNASYLAFVQLQQHVEVFRGAMRRQAEVMGVRADDVAAWVVGRQKDGSPVSPEPGRLAHAGRGYARWLPANEGNRHRILRRGIPYGLPLADGAADDGGRGLLFVAYQADLARQFEHVWSQWLNGPDFPGPGAGTDALVGQLPGNSLAGPRSGAAITDGGSRPTSISRPSQKGGLSLLLPAFTTPRYGGYFLSPSISALAQLAG